MRVVWIPPVSVSGQISTGLGLGPCNLLVPFSGESHLQ